MKSQVMSNIVRMLENEGPFKDVIYVILENVSKYLKMPDVTVMQYDEERTCLYPVLSYGGRHHLIQAAEVQAAAAQTAPQGTVERQVKAAADSPLYGEKLCYYRADTAQEPVRMALADANIKTSVTAPVKAEDKVRMYLCVSDSTNNVELDAEQLRFVSDVANVIQSIMQERINKDSLSYSYEVLKEILGSIDSGIMVYDRQTKEVLFENDIVKNCNDIKRVIQTCVTFYFTGENTKSIQEHCDAQSGLWYEVHFSDLRWLNGNPAVVCTAVDVTQKKKNQQKIEYQAHNDFLTGLYNRMKCENDLRHIVRKAVRDKEKGAVLFMDLDDFKHINDGLGHQYGDVLLQQVAAGLQGIAGIRGHCYRMGGDEFVIIILPQYFNIWEKIVKNIIAMFRKPWYLMETEYFCTMSMGVAFFPDDGTEVDDIIKTADIAMYEAKKAGKNQYSIYDNTSSENVSKRLDIENNMRQAVASEIQEFLVYYQPVVDAVTKKCTSCEALVRWDSKSLGFMGPSDFVPLAEYLGLITSIGDYVLEEACNQCRYWNEHGYPDFHVNVNLSVVQLLQKDVVKNIEKILLKTGVNPKNINLEITESFAINDMNRVLEIIKGLKKLGPRIALDDFGTGYSSLNYIKQLPLDLIKVDKTFIDDILEDEYAQAFVRLIVELSKTIGTKLVVEGVEHQEQYELLRGLGVHYIQGFYFGKPAAAKDFEQKYLASWKPEQ